jgi:branched-chain amino acid transport system permease protein
VIQAFAERLQLPPDHPARRAADAVRRLWRLPGPLGQVIRIACTAFAFYATLSLLLRNQRPPVGIFLYGGIVGLLYALVAFGLILIYRANRIINFANAEIGAAAASAAVLLMKSRFDVPYVVAFFIAVAAAVLSGAVVEIVFIRRFADAPRLLLSVATIGIGLIFAAVQFFMPSWITGRFVDPSAPQTPLTSLRAEIGGFVFDANSLTIVVAVGLIVLALGAFFRYTDIGIAVRASAENADRAALVGIPVKRVSTVVWVIASVMAAIGIFLRAPVIGLPIGNTVGPQVLLFGLAAAVVARMEHFPRALAAGIAFGALEQCLWWFNRDPSLGAAIVLPVLLAVMLVQRRRQARTEDPLAGRWAMAREFRPIPPELRRVPVVQWARVLVPGAVVLAALLAPLGMNVFQQNIAGLVIVYGIVAVSLVILTGWAGQISLGQWGFVGIGAAVAGGLAGRLNADFFLTLLAAGVVGAIAALIIGLPALRIQGLYLAVTTLAFAIMVPVVVLSPTYSEWLLPERASGIRRPMLYGRFDLADDRTFYFVALLVLVLAVVSARSLRNSRTGRTLIAVRDNSRAAQSYGISVAGSRLTAFALSGFWAGTAGGLFAYHQGAIDAQAYAPAISIDVLVMVVIGGLTTIPGALLGTGVIAFFRYNGYAAQTQFLATGVGVLVILMLLPGGLAQLLYGARDRLLREVAARRGIRVPSLVADEGTDDAEAEADIGVAADRLAAVEAVVAATDGPMAAPGGVLTCPQCGEDVLLELALHHEHFVANGHRTRRRPPRQAGGTRGVRT